MDAGLEGIDGGHGWLDTWSLNIFWEVDWVHLCCGLTSHDIFGPPGQTGFIKYLGLVFLPPLR